ncbi:tRNA-dihydrouridine synthase [Kipferlia bialata]|uniref:tRNA-dihydrouridine(16/17) synthase [NAD(P)(+)] n=1 Tax=Kipferlia bialata TaxID=797122 RepID=A0A9K3GH89_9EUKA|nr:tRNA-dihydrouridine synthase [Kipferlia bialata]GIQ85838.1 tRNA-dihydrouridine synthase [Kipferlia bialata]|eukprot:g4198.t1
MPKPVEICVDDVELPTAYPQFVGMDLAKLKCMELPEVMPPIPTSIHAKPSGEEFLATLGNPTTMLAPMVLASETATRVLTRMYGVDVTYSPMVNVIAATTNPDLKGIVKRLDSTDRERPIIVQYAGHEARSMLRVALRVDHRHCDAIDINFGCPQNVARKGHYGSYLRKHWPLVYQLIATLHVYHPLPVTAKMRLLDTPEQSVDFARLIEAAGAQMLVVHGRGPTEKQQSLSKSRWDVIRRIRESVSIPVYANGDVVDNESHIKCMEETGCRGTMSGRSLSEYPGTYLPTEEVERRLARFDHVHFMSQHGVDYPSISASVREGRVVPSPKGETTGCLVPVPTPAEGEAEAEAERVAQWIRRVKLFLQWLSVVQELKREKGETNTEAVAEAEGEVETPAPKGQVTARAILVHMAGSMIGRPLLKMHTDVRASIFSRTGGVECKGKYPSSAQDMTRLARLGGTVLARLEQGVMYSKEAATQ